MTDYDALVSKAVEGDKEALTGLIEAIRDRIYGISIRMLSHPEDAEDAAQEILLKIITNLGTWRGESSFMTWAYRIASNHLVTTRKRSRDEVHLNFEDFGARIDRGVGVASRFEATQTDHLLEREIRLSCTHGMLVCLSREERIAYILGAIYEVSSDEGALLLDIPSATYRKRLSRARGRLEEFMKNRCGIFDSKNACRCKKQGQVALGTGALTQEEYRFASLPVLGDLLAHDERRQFVDLLSAAMVLGTQPQYKTPQTTVDMLDKILNEARPEP